VGRLCESTGRTLVLMGKELWPNAAYNAAYNVDRGAYGTVTSSSSFSWSSLLHTGLPSFSLQSPPSPHPALFVTLGRHRNGKG
jgi:hypothetical protein